METRTRKGEPGERCTCGRQASEVFLGGPFGDTGYCGRPDGGDQTGPCPFCGAATKCEGRCSQYQVGPQS